MGAAVAYLITANPCNKWTGIKQIVMWWLDSTYGKDEWDNFLNTLKPEKRTYARENKEEIITRIYNDIIEHYMLDLLLGNIDNGRYNYELIVGDDNAYLSPYSDFGMIFNYTSTNLKVNSKLDNSLYNNLEELLTDKDYYNRFITMYNKLTPAKLEEIEENLNLEDNFKNIIFLSYTRHYLLVGDILKRINKKKIK